MNGIISVFVVFILLVLLMVRLREHPQSTSSFMAADALPMKMPSQGGEGKSVVVIGGGISGLTTAKYLLQAGCNVTLLEQRNIVGGNNDPYLEGGRHYSTTVIITLPAQQPHYLNLCRELGIEQTPHQFSELEGSIVFENKEWNTRMGAGLWPFLKFLFKKASLMEIVDGINIFIKLYYQFKCRPESNKSVRDLLGNRLIDSTVFTHFFMPWVGINTWCRFEDLDNQPAHVFASFIFEYALTLKVRDETALGDENGWCVLDGRIIHALEQKLMLNDNYIQKTNSKIEDISRNKEGGLIVKSQEGGSWSCDHVVMATQPFQAVPLISDLAPDSLIDELNKWGKMDCYVLLHSDFSSIKKMPWLHQTHKNKTTNKFYITNTIKPVMSDIELDYVITYVYNTGNYHDFIAHHIDKSKIVKTYEPKLPIFNLENSIDRNSVWRDIDHDCIDIHWTQACRSGLQYHNNGILSAKRVVKSVLGLHW